ncbi:hypothetical protein XENORESO_012613 [Xenotaenia resolanae]|uniref:Uncharacterized protein n=1 Tax=Xenotaenia resolanae TaxID=208358 RepID=A0ABV0WYG2_9TELE
MAQTHAYRLLPHQVSAAQTRTDSLVSALWHRIFPGLHFGPNHKLERIFARMLHHPESSAMQICPYYFDQVTWKLPAASPWLVLLSELLTRTHAGVMFACLSTLKHQPETSFMG